MVSFTHCITLNVLIIKGVLSLKTAGATDMLVYVVILFYFVMNLLIALHSLRNLRHLLVLNSVLHVICKYVHDQSMYQI
jgi:hypothetical protein